ncbi:hypothetical protein H6F89_11345 [Cyanobacteria bacterium FACHB-63]|nr:hypothetical protein [Cyanobacteria bacterium FACHB-63]
MRVKQKNQKRVKGVPVQWEEVKVQKMIGLTPTVWQLIDARAAELNLSRSELVERTFRGLITWTEFDSTLLNSQDNQS